MRFAKNSQTFMQFILLVICVRRSLRHKPSFPPLPPLPPLLILHFPLYLPFLFQLVWYVYGFPFLSFLLLPFSNKPFTTHQSKERKHQHWDKGTEIQGVQLGIKPRPPIMHTSALMTELSHHSCYKIL